MANLLEFPWNTVPYFDKVKEDDDDFPNQHPEYMSGVRDILSVIDTLAHSQGGMLSVEQIHTMNAKMQEILIKAYAKKEADATFGDEDLFVEDIVGKPLLEQEADEEEKGE